MSLDRFAERVRSAEELAAVAGTPSPLSLKKELRALDVHMRRFVAASPFVLLGTHSKDGRCDVSPRGDAPGFVRVLDDETLLIPDRPGNKRFDSLRNIVETGRVGLLFLVPGFGETLRVNGAAAVVRGEEWLAPFEVNGKRPNFAVAVAAEECFLQCAKALIRSRLWEPGGRPELDGLACAAEMLADHVNSPDYDVEKLQSLLDVGYKNNLY